MSDNKQDELEDRPLNPLIDNFELKPKYEEDPQYYRAIAHLKSTNADAVQISALLGVEIDEVNRVLGLRRIKDLIFEIQKKYANRDFQNLFKDLLPDAVDTVRTLMLDSGTKEGTRLSAAVAIMDRALGKPSQNVDIGSSMIRDLFAALDKHEKIRIDKAIQIESKSVNNEVVEGEFTEMNKEAVNKAPENPTDLWVKANLK